MALWDIWAWLGLGHRLVMSPGVSRNLLWPRPSAGLTSDSCEYVCQQTCNEKKSNLLYMIWWSIWEHWNSWHRPLSDHFAWPSSVSAERSVDPLLLFNSEWANWNFGRHNWLFICCLFDSFGLKAHNLPLTYIVTWKIWKKELLIKHPQYSKMFVHILFIS